MGQNSLPLPCRRLQHRHQQPFSRQTTGRLNRCHLPCLPAIAPCFSAGWVVVEKPLVPDCHWWPIQSLLASGSMVQSLFAQHCRPLKSLLTPELTLSCSWPFHDVCCWFAVWFRPVLSAEPVSSEIASDELTTCTVVPDSLLLSLGCAIGFVVVSTDDMSSTLLIVADVENGFSEVADLSANVGALGSYRLLRRCSISALAHRRC